MSRLRIGIDVGGTNTDCVLLDPTLQSTPSRGIIACAKTLTTSDITTGIFNAIKKVIEQSQIDVDRISIVTVGTTHFLNAIIERDVTRLDRVGIIRLSSSFTRSIPPFSDFPKDLKAVLYGHHGFVSGGLQINGVLIGEIDEAEIIEECKIIKQKGLKVVVIAGVYSPIDTLYQQEYKVREIVLRELPGVRVVCSRDVGTVGFLERENSAILNGSILRFSEYIINSFKIALVKLNLKSTTLYLTQNDGTMISSDEVKGIPIVTFNSGPTNSILGASYLSQLDNKKLNSNVIVADIGGTTTDIGVLLPSGFPKQASAYLTVAGVRINYSMPQLHSIGLGGGSIIRHLEDGHVSVGPDSVGYRLNEKAIIFGGDTLTTTDIASLKESNESIENSDTSLLDKLNLETDKISEKIHEVLSKAIDVIKTSQDDVPLLLVGGGSIIIDQELEGISQVIRPKYHQHANAVGAAVAKVSYTIDTIINNSQVGEVENMKKKTIEKLISTKNALESTCYIVDVISIPVEYSNDKVRVIIKAAGDIDFSKNAHSSESLGDIDYDAEFNGLDSYSNGHANGNGHLNGNGHANGNGHLNGNGHVNGNGNGTLNGSLNGDAYKQEEEEDEEEELVKALDYIPAIKDGVWNISKTDLLWLSNGCYVLGCAGGGSPQCEYLEVLNLLNEGVEIKLKQWETLQEGEIVGWAGIMGSPTVSYERLGGTDTIDALTEVLSYLGKECDAIMSLEIGGANGLQALLLASSKYFNKPLVDCDWMGRAYPTFYQTTLATHEEGQLVPSAIADGIGNSMILTKAIKSTYSDSLLRSVCSELGSRVGYAGKPTEADLVKKHSVKNSYSLAWRIGRQIAYCQENNCTNLVADRIIEEVGGSKSAKKLYTGKIVSVEQKLFKAHSYGQIVIQAFHENEEESTDGSKYPFEATGGLLRIPFKNEIIYAEHENEEGTKTILASVPDLIGVIDTQSGKAIGVAEFKYGLRVVVVGIACSDLWNDNEVSRSVGGLESFGLHDIKHESIGVYRETKSVIEEYNNKK